MARLREIIPIEAILEKLDRIQEQGLPSRENSMVFKETPPKKIQPLKEAQPDYSGQPRTEKPDEKVLEKKTAPEPDSGNPTGPPDLKGTETFSKEDLLEFIRQHHLPLAAYLAHGEVRFVDENTLEWDFKDKAFHMELLEGNGNKKKLEILCQDFFKRKLKVLFIGQGKEKSNGRRAGALDQDRQKRLSVKEALIQPQVKDLIDIFQAEVVDIKRPSENG